MLFDFIVIGGGIVGMATARELALRHRGSDILVLEKEPRLAAHQTGHNSGVVHAGIYYTPGSLKARLCVEGAATTKRFCADHAIPVEVCGKLVVATHADDLARLRFLVTRAAENGAAFTLIDAAELRRREPHIAGKAAGFAPETAIVDYGRITRALADDATAHGAIVMTDMDVTTLREDCDGVTVRASDRPWRGRRVIVCAGLQSDRLARTAGLDPPFRIVPFRGEYFVLPESREGLISHLIYPVPDPNVPFLGIHLTRLVGGGVIAGPNAVLGLARERYGRLAFAQRDALDTLGYRGFWQLLWRHRAHAAGELLTSVSRRHYLAKCRRYCPDLTLDDLGERRVGIRAQAVRHDGTLVDDFQILRTDRMLHVCNAPSPAATSALPIARHIVNRLDTD